MNRITIKRMYCFENEDDAGDDEIKLRIKADHHYGVTLRNSDFDNHQTWQINRSYTFENKITLEVYDEDPLSDDDKLGSHIFDTRVSMYDATASFTKDESDYELIFDLVVEEDSSDLFEPQLGRISLRSFFSRMGRGMMDPEQHRLRILERKIYQIGNEVISLGDAFDRNASQDGVKSNTDSIREWIQTHCNFFSKKTYQSNKPRSSQGATFFQGKNWKKVSNELSHEIAGFQEYSTVTPLDNPTSHATRDWNWNLFPDPQFMYLLGEGMKSKGQGNELIPFMHNEWETGSFPVQWRPFWGEYITFWGRHVWDTGHAPVVTEIHPAHSIVRERTSASPIGINNSIVPVNQAIIGMGASGGFPNDTLNRWQHEFGDIPNFADFLEDHPKTINCWPTNLKKHPLKFKFYPPVERPSNTATLVFNIKLCQHINVSGIEAFDKFLNLTRQDDPSEGGKKKAFRDWHRTSGHPPINTSIDFQPTATLVNSPDGAPAYFDVEVDLSNMPDIPVGYYAIVECGWSERGNNLLQEYEVTFEEMKVNIKGNSFGNEWHLYYGANGVWNAWWNGKIKAKKSYKKDTSIKFWVLNDMPIVIRDCGVEWHGLLSGNDVLDKLGLVIKGPKHLKSLNEDLIKVDFQHFFLLSSDDKSTRFKVKGKSSKDSSISHEWIINLERTQTLWPY